MNPLLEMSSQLPWKVIFTQVWCDRPRALLAVVGNLWPVELEVSGMQREIVGGT